MITLIKQMNTFFLFASYARDSNGMPNPNGTAVVMKFNDILDLVQHLYFLSAELHLMCVPEGNSAFCFPENLRLEEKQNSLFPEGVHIKCFVI